MEQNSTLTKTTIIEEANLSLPLTNWLN